MNDEQQRFLEHDDFCVRLRFSGDDLDPGEISRLLGAPLTQEHSFLVSSVAAGLSLGRL
jgi:hypothetical protein